MAGRWRSLMVDFHPDPGTPAYRLASLVDADGRGSAAISRIVKGHPNLIRDLLRRPTARWSLDILEPLAAEIGTTAGYILQGTGERVEMGVSPVHATPLRHRVQLKKNGPWPLWQRGNIVTCVESARVDVGQYVIVFETAVEYDAGDLTQALERGPYLVRKKEHNDDTGEPLLTVEPAGRPSEARQSEEYLCYRIVAIEAV